MHIYIFYIFYIFYILHPHAKRLYIYTEILLCTAANIKFHTIWIFSNIHKNIGVEKYGYNINPTRISTETIVTFLKYIITIHIQRITKVQ
jgi:hypothetical protein